MICHRIKGESMADASLHIPSPLNTYLSLCGWCDAAYDEIEGKPDCKNCLRIVRVCKRLNLSAGVSSSEPKESE